MSILSYRPEELATSRKIASDIKNNTDSLTFSSRERGSSHGVAAKAVREHNDDLEAKVLQAPIDSAAYFDNLEC